MLKTSLNSTKRLLNGKEMDAWHIHTAKTNRAGSAFDRVKHVVKPELLTQAWLKFYECLSEYHLVDLDESKDEDVTTFQSIHLCEAPGAFVAALNHYLALNFAHVKVSYKIGFSILKYFYSKLNISLFFIVKLEWLATTLNPYYEGNSSNCMIDDDRFIFHTLEHWHFGSDDTGSVTEASNLESLMKRTEGNEISLVRHINRINA